MIRVLVVIEDASGREQLVEVEEDNNLSRIGNLSSLNTNVE